MRPLLRRIVGPAVFLAALSTLASEPGDAVHEAATVRGPELIGSTLVVPSYPFEALAQGGDAVVLVGFVVGDDGRVADVRVLDTDRPDVGFETAALSAVSAWRYRPAVRGGQPIPVFHAVRLRFREPENRAELLARGPASLDGASFVRRTPGPLPNLPALAGPSPKGAGAAGAGEPGLSRVLIPEGCAGNRPCLQTRRRGVVTLRPGRQSPPNLIGNRPPTGTSKD